MSRFGVQLDSQTHAGLYRALWGGAIVSGSLALIVAAAMALSLYRLRGSDPLHSPALHTARQTLHESPSDARLISHIRELDRGLRQQFFDARSFSRRGLWLLMPSLAVMVTCLRILRRFDETPPVPPSQPPPAERSNRASLATRWSVAGLGVLVLGTACGVIGLRSPVLRPAGAAGESGPEAAGGIVPVAGYWPSFRGPDGGGASPYPDAIDHWDGPSGRNILWKTPIPLPGHNSAVAAHGRVFVTGATAARRAVFAFDARTGRTLWQHDVNDLSPRDAEPPVVLGDTGYAAPTAATDGRHVFAIFPTGDLVACDLDGRRVWGKHLGQPDNHYGYSNSLAVHRGRVIVQWDQGYPDDDHSAVMAFEGDTGKEAWRLPRKTAASWSSPVVVQSPSGPQLITLAEPWIASIDPAEGRELWRCEGVNGDVAVSPVLAAGLVLAVNPSDRVLAIRPDGSGDVTRTHIVWRAEGDIPDIASPAADDRFFYLLTTTGRLVCRRLSDGGVVWSHDFQTSFNASPCVVGDRLYLISTSGTTIICRTGDRFEELGRHELGEGVFSSPCFLEGMMIVRGQKHLWAIGGPGR